MTEKSYIDSEIDYNLAKIFVTKVGGDLTYAQSLLQVLAIDAGMEIFTESVVRNDNLMSIMLKDYEKRKYTELSPETIYEPFIFV